MKQKQLFSAILTAIARKHEKTIMAVNLNLY